MASILSKDQALHHLTCASRSSGLCGELIAPWPSILRTWQTKQWNHPTSPWHSPSPLLTLQVVLVAPWTSMVTSMITSPLRIMIAAVLSVTVGELTPGTATAAEQGLQYTQQTNQTTWPSPLLLRPSTVGQTTRPRTCPCGSTTMRRCIVSLESRGTVDTITWSLP